MSVVKFPTRLRVIESAGEGSDEQVIGRRLRSAFCEMAGGCPKVVIAIERKKGGEMDYVYIFIPYDNIFREHVAEAVFHPKFGIASVERGRPSISPTQGLPGEPQEDAPLYWQVSVYDCGYIEECIDAWRQEQQDT